MQIRWLQINIKFHHQPKVFDEKSKRSVTPINRLHLCNYLENKSGSLFIRVCVFPLTSFNTFANWLHE